MGSIMRSVRKFNLVDFAAHYQKGFRNHIVSIDEVPALVESFKRYGWLRDLLLLFRRSAHSHESLQAEESAPTIAGYEGKVRAPFLPIDLDHPDLAPALGGARKLSSFLLRALANLTLTLSKSILAAQGFHLMLDTRVFGKILPSKNLPPIFDSLRAPFGFRDPLSLSEIL